MLVLFTAPLITLVLDDPIANVNYWAFLAHILPVSFAASATWFWSRQWQFPQNLRLSWRGVLLHLARWVVVLSAFIQVVFRVRKPYMITVKGMGAKGIPRFPLSVLVPYVALVGLPLGACWFYLGVYGGGPSQGYLFFALKGAVLFWLMLVVLLAHDVYSVTRSGVPLLQTLQARGRALITVLSLTVLVTVTAMSSAGLIVEALTA
jgi:hypothetical protein